MKNNKEICRKFNGSIIEISRVSMYVHCTCRKLDNSPLFLVFSNYFQSLRIVENNRRFNNRFSREMSTRKSDCVRACAWKNENRTVHADWIRTRSCVNSWIMTRLAGKSWSWLSWWYCLNSCRYSAVEDTAWMAERQVESNTLPYMYRLRPIYLGALNLWLVGSLFDRVLLPDKGNLLGLEFY